METVRTPESCIDEIIQRVRDRKFPNDSTAIGFAVRTGSDNKWGSFTEVTIRKKNIGTYDRPEWIPYKAVCQGVEREFMYYLRVPITQSLN